MFPKPIETPKRNIRPGHSHADGLKAAYLFNERGTSVFDYTRNRNSLDVVNATRVANSLQVDANGEYASLNNTNQIINSDTCTIIMRFKSLSAFTDSNHRFMIYASSTPNIYIAKLNSNVLKVNLSNGSTSRSVEIGSAKVPNWQVGTTIAVQWNKYASIYDSKNIALNIDGSYVVPDSSSNATALDSFTVPSNVILLNHSLLTLFANGILEYLYIYNRILIASTLRGVHNDQYAMFY